MYMVVPTIGFYFFFFLNNPVGGLANIALLVPHSSKKL